MRTKTLCCAVILALFPVVGLAATGPFVKNGSITVNAQPQSEDPIWTPPLASPSITSSGLLSAFAATNMSQANPNSPQPSVAPCPAGYSGSNGTYKWSGSDNTGWVLTGDTGCVAPPPPVVVQPPVVSTPVVVAINPAAAQQAAAQQAAAQAAAQQAATQQAAAPALKSYSCPYRSNGTLYPVCSVSEASYWGGQNAPISSVLYIPGNTGMAYPFNQPHSIQEGRKSMYFGGTPFGSTLTFTCYTPRTGYCQYSGSGTVPASPVN